MSLLLCPTVANAAFLQEPIFGLSWEPWQDVVLTQSFTFQLTRWLCATNLIFAHALQTICSLFFLEICLLSLPQPHSATLTLLFFS